MERVGRLEPLVEVGKLAPRDEVLKLAPRVERQKMEQNFSLLRLELYLLLFWLGSWRRNPDAEVLVFCFQEIFLHQMRCWWVQPAAGAGVESAAEPEVESAAGSAFLQLVGTSEVGLTAGTSDFEMTAGTGEAGLTAGTLEVVQLAGISGVEPLSVAGIFEVQQFAL